MYASTLCTSRQRPCGDFSASARQASISTAAVSTGGPQLSDNFQLGQFGRQRPRTLPAASVRPAHASAVRDGSLCGTAPTAAATLPPQRLIGAWSIAPKAAIAYIRVSTQGQGRSGLGLQAQEDAIARFSRAEGFAVAETFTEVETGKGADALERRRKLAAAIKAARKLKGPVIVSKLDRLSRDVHFISGLMAHCASFRRTRSSCLA